MPFFRFIAIRLCPCCYAVLKKTDPASELKCVCGWIWK